MLTVLVLKFEQEKDLLYNAYSNKSALKRLKRIEIDVKHILDVANQFNVSIGTARNIVTNILKYRTICCQWVPSMLSESHKKQRMGLSLQHSLRYWDDGDEFLQHIVAEDTANRKENPSVYNGNIPTHLGLKNSKLSG
ncbi:hypothetical protein TNCV_494141 [Trichonephila clavipes]|nr:hypothetical protein TNCV_494141 [Trichonephila clavipes]